jgi:hypothetical protein
MKGQMVAVQKGTVFVDIVKKQFGDVIGGHFKFLNLPRLICDARALNTIRYSIVSIAP